MSESALEEHVTADGETVYVSQREGDRGSKAPFLVVYRTADQERKYGYFCANCETFDNAMDTMGRIQCNSCGNLRKPTEWDAAHE
ncbi:DUF5816 domain-containing protein [Haloarchaeobius sp. DT45]|uniref:DUF5816 domain-containing protein n=1 Tax=Haloarchaeobius sp. DT45 TaxID=3446116 RepID=UPI003F6AEB16